MDIKYHMIDPTGNITILVETPVKIEDQPFIGKLLMTKEPICEQVGFISKGDKDCDIILRMAGGEFCGNATMSAAVFWAKESGLSDGNKIDVVVKVLGVSDHIDVLVERCGEEYFGSVTMPRPLSITTEEFFYDGHKYRYPVVNFPGISHLVVDDYLPVTMAEEAIKVWAQEKGYEGIGLMNLSRDHKQLRPLVYIPLADSLVWESSCASGTTSVGAYYAYRDRKDCHFEFEEPGGILTIDAGKDGSLKLSGKVSFMGSN